MLICTLLSPEEPYSNIRQKYFQCCLLLVKSALSHHRHQDVTKEVEHGVKMISKEAQFSLFNFNLFKSIQVSISCTQASNLLLLNSISLRDDVSKVIYSCVSSA